MMKKLIIWYLSVLSVLSVASSLVLRMVWPDHFPGMLYTIPLFYAVMLGVMLILKRSIEKKGKDRSIFFLSYRVVKIMIALAFLLIFFSMVRTELLAFTVVFMIFYLCLSAVETVFFMKGEKKS
jgi:hypothetical protein